MAEYVIMPKLGLNMDKGTIVKWVKKEGDCIKEQEVIFEVETDKTVMEVEAQISGILRKILVAEGEEVLVTFPIAIIGDKDEDINKMIDDAYQKLKKNQMTGKEQLKTNKEFTSIIKGKQKIKSKEEDKEEFRKISPRAQKKAKELGIEVQLLKGSGPEGLVIEEDVIFYYQKHKIKASSITKELAEETGIKSESLTGAGIDKEMIKKDIQEVSTKTAEVEKIEKRVPYTGIRKIIGDRLSMSKFSAPHVYFTISVDMYKAKELLNKFNQETEIKISINDLIVFVVSKVLREQPNLNCSLIDEEIIYREEVNIGVAVALEEGLIVPVVRNANSKSLSTLSKEIKELIKLARERKLMPDDYRGGTFTVSNLGMYGIEQFTAIINPPEAAILAIGAIKKMPIVIEDGEEKVRIRPLMNMTLSVDHRLIDGAVAAQFLNHVKHRLEFPESLIFKK